MKAVQKLIDCFIPVRETIPAGRMKNKVADEDIASQNTAETAPAISSSVHAKLTAVVDTSGTIRACDAGILTASEMAALEKMPDDNKPHYLRHKSPRHAQSSTPVSAQAHGSQTSSARVAAVHHVNVHDVGDSARLVRQPREKSMQEVHNELVLETKLSPQHPALQSCWLMKQIGQGAFSKVYLACPRTIVEGFPGQYVLKVVDLGNDCKLRDDYKHILRAEGNWLSKFNQPGFVKCYGSWGATPANGSDEVPEHLVLALESLSGGMLLDRLKKGPMAEHHAAAAFYQMLTAIMFMHHMGYVHRDLKPDNVMLTTDWDPVRDAEQPPPIKLIDLGMVLNYVETPNACGLMGSPGYMSPEAIRGHRHTPAMDMFSLGVLLFVMLTGCKPLPSAVCTKLSYDQMEACDYPGLKMQQFKRLSPEAKDLVLALLQRRPQHRPSARAALQHCWLVQHHKLWREHGIEIRYMAITAHAMKHVLLKSSGADVPSSRHHRSRASAGSTRPPSSARALNRAKTADAGQIPVLAPEEPFTKHASCEMASPQAFPVMSAAVEQGASPPFAACVRKSNWPRESPPCKQLPASESASAELKENVVPLSPDTAEASGVPCSSPVSAPLGANTSPRADDGTGTSPREVSPAALSHTIRNMLGILQGSSCERPPPRRGPPSAEAITSAINAVVDAAKVVQAEGCTPKSGYAAMPSLPTAGNSPQSAVSPKQCAVGTAVYAMSPYMATPSPVQKPRNPAVHHTPASAPAPTLHSGDTPHRKSGELNRVGSSNAGIDSRAEEPSTSALTRVLPVIRLNEGANASQRLTHADRAASAPMPPHLHGSPPPSASDIMNQLAMTNMSTDSTSMSGGGWSAEIKDQENVNINGNKSSPDVPPEARVTLRVTSSKALSDGVVAVALSGVSAQSEKLLETRVADPVAQSPASDMP